MSARPSPTAMSRLTMHDQLLVNLCGWLACQVIMPSPNFEMMVAQLSRVIPNTSPDHPLVRPLAEAAVIFARTAKTWRSLEHHSAGFKLRMALEPVFMARAGAASAAIWPEENSQSEEPAHAAE